MLHRLSLIQNQVFNKMAVASEAQKPDINLYTAQTPNGIKISMTLEETRVRGEASLAQVLLILMCLFKLTLQSA